MIRGYLVSSGFFIPKNFCPVNPGNQFNLNALGPGCYKFALVIPQALSQDIILLPANQTIQMPTWRDHLEVCGLLGLWNHSACQCSASPLSFHSKSFESQGKFEKHLFGLQFCRSSVHLPGPSPRVME